MIVEYDNSPRAAIGASASGQSWLRLGQLQGELDAAYHHEDLAAEGQHPGSGEDPISGDADRQQAR